LNLILLHQHEIDANGTITLQDRRAKHICEIIKPAVGDTLSTGIIDAAIGQARVLAISASDDYSVTLNIAELSQLSLNTQQFQKTNQQTLPQALDITLIIALPRPKVARRLVRLCVECGVKTIYFINSYRVEKSFWQSPMLHEEKFNEQIILGLEQCKDTIWPSVSMHKRFKPFVEDQLPDIVKGKQAVVAHPYQAEIDISADRQAITQRQKHASVIVIGPEGGFIPYEIELLQKTGLKTMGLGKRIYRVETVVPLLLGKLGL